MYYNQVSFPFPTLSLRVKIVLCKCLNVRFLFPTATICSNWLTIPFSAGDFKEVTQKAGKCTPQQMSVKTEQEQSYPTESEECGIFSCPQEGCIRVFQRHSSLEKHLSVETCTKALEKHTLLDLAKLKYASILKESASSIPNIEKVSRKGSNAASPFSDEGWALRGAKKPYKFNEKQREYLEAKFDIGLGTGRKVSPEIVAREMRHAKDAGGDKLFSSSEFLSAQQISSYFSRLSAKGRSQLVSEMDLRAVEEECNFASAREAVLSTLDLQHPITYDQFNICSLVRDRKLSKLKVGMLQMIVEALNLESPLPPVRRKAPYIAALEEAVKKCSCTI